MESTRVIDWVGRSDMAVNVLEQTLSDGSCVYAVGLPDRDGDVRYFDATDKRAAYALAFAFAQHTV